MRELAARVDAKMRAVAAQDGAVFALAGRNEYMLADFKRSSEFLEKAVALEPANSDDVWWLGRAYGRRAETSSPLTAPGYASRARQNFERAVELNPRNLDALGDLFEYYLEAPGFLGGGMDKARATAERIAAIDAGEGHRVQANLAEKRKEYATAEMELRPRRWAASSNWRVSWRGRAVSTNPTKVWPGRRSWPPATRG